MYVCMYTVRHVRLTETRLPACEEVHFKIVRVREPAKANQVVKIHWSNNKNKLIQQLFSIRISLLWFLVVERVDATWTSR